MGFNDNDDCGYNDDCRQKTLINKVVGVAVWPFRFIVNALRGPTGVPGPQGQPGSGDVCCPNCEVWYSDLPAHKKSVFILPCSNPDLNDDPNFLTIVCGNCGHESDWFTGAPMFIPAQDIVIHKPLTGFQKRQNRKNKRSMK